MNRERAKELLPIIEAFANGEGIQRKDPDGKWTPLLEENVLYDTDTEYRIKPKPREFWLNVYPQGDYYGYDVENTAIRHCDNQGTTIKVRAVTDEDL